MMLNSICVCIQIYCFLKGASPVVERLSHKVCPYTLTEEWLWSSFKYIYICGAERYLLRLILMEINPVVLLLLFFHINVLQWWNWMDEAASLFAAVKSRIIDLWAWAHCFVCNSYLPTEICGDCRYPHSDVPGFMWVWGSELKLSGLHRKWRSELSLHP